MKYSEISDNVFLKAVSAIDAGDEESLRALIQTHPRLLSDPLDFPQGTYFKNPYLIYFLANNPIRCESLPANILDVARLLLTAMKQKDVPELKQKLDYTLGLVATGLIPRVSGVQIPLIDLLVSEGATPQGTIGAIAHGNAEAASHLLRLGAELTLPSAVGLRMVTEVQRLLAAASSHEVQVALMVAAFNGDAAMTRLLLGHGADPNQFIPDTSDFHSHGTALHQAVASGSLETVIALIEAGADTALRDRIYNGLPIGWASHMKEDETDVVKQKKFADIELYLRTLDE